MIDFNVSLMNFNGTFTTVDIDDDENGADFIAHPDVVIAPAGNIEVTLFHEKVVVLTSDLPWTNLRLVQELAKLFQGPRPKGRQTGIHYPAADRFGTFWCGHHYFLEDVIPEGNNRFVLFLGS